MRIAIIETGTPIAQQREHFSSFPEMMVRMLAPFSDRFDFTITNVEEDALPSPADSDGLLLTGSPAGVYEGHEWIPPLEDLVRHTAATGRPQVGVCFGHQLMAQAFGGAVEKSDKGWGVGLHVYELKAAADWTDPRQGQIACAVSHQDQVVRPPEGATVIAGSDFCPYGLLSYAEGPAISFQMHPEFETDFALDLLRIRRNRIGDALADEAAASLKRRSDRHLLATWIANFYRSFW